MLGGEGLLKKAQRHLERKPARDEALWVQRQEQGGLRQRLRSALPPQEDARLDIWACVRLVGERNVDVARAYGYRDGSGVSQVVRRLEQQSVRDAELRQKMARIRENLSRVKS